MARHIENPVRDAWVMLDAIRQAQARFIVDTTPGDSFGDLLKILLSITESEYGFIGEVFNQADGAPYLKTHAITNIAWNAETRALASEGGLEFHNPKSLFGAVLTTGKPVMVNDPANDPRSGGLPPGHPAMRSFMGLPIFSNDKMVGMIGVANHPNGYTQELGRASARNFGLHPQGVSPPRAAAKLLALARKPDLQAVDFLHVKSLTDNPG